jgi:hypothetical protein
LLLWLPLWGLLSPLLLLRLPLRGLLSPLLLMLRLSLRVLLLCGWPGALLLPTRPTLRLALILVPLVVLLVRREHSPEEQQQGGTRNSNDLHGNPLS